MYFRLEGGGGWGGGVVEILGEHMVFRESEGGASLSQQRIKERLQKN